ncbi:hypothetical protein GQ41_1619 [Arenibacter algicola]|uniref:DUF4304 domain-containing protein n=1 Tax=Arenibacter algicola TaxID=616991 RepID=A0ABY3ADA3_9FLAO
MNNPHHLGIKEYLDQSLNKYYIGILKDNGFELVKSKMSGMAGFYVYKSNWLNFIIANDRGIIETNISSLYSKEYYDFDIINAYLLRLDGLNSSRNKFGGNDLTKRLNLEQESNLFKSNIELIKELFNKENYKKTEFELDRIGNERADLLFGPIK